MLKHIAIAILMLTTFSQQLSGQETDREIHAKNPTFDPVLYRQLQSVMPALLETGAPQVESFDTHTPPPVFELDDPVFDPMAEHSKAVGFAKAFPNRRYNQVRQKSSHNSFQKQEALIDQLVYHRIRSLELDLHTSKGSSWPITAQDWYVYHFAGVDADTTCHRFSDCLDELRSFHDATPDHEVVTVFLDIKDSWKSTVNPSDLDARIQAHLPPSAVFRPADWVSNHCPGETTLKGVASNPSCGWPLLRDLRGKFIFVLTGKSDYLNQYVSNNSVALLRTAFVAHKAEDLDDIDAHDYGVFFNMTTSNQSLAVSINSRGFIGRSYYVNSSSTWSNAEFFGVHHLATDKINYHQDPWARTHNANGWPFECFVSCSSSLEEEHQTIGVEVDSEDIWGSSDHFRFHYEITSGNNFWTAAINTKNSHTEDWAKGCLMARQAFSSSSPYFAVCRPNDDHKLRIQWRSSTGGSTSRTDGNIVPNDTIDEESITRVALYVYNSGTCAAGYGSVGGSSWQLIGYKCFSQPLSRQGLASSSHDGGKIKFLYSSVRKNGVLYSKNTFPYSFNFGTVRSAQVFDGIFP